MVQLFFLFIFYYRNFQDWAELLLCSASIIQEISEIPSYFLLWFFPTHLILQFIRVFLEAKPQLLWKIELQREKTDSNRLSSNYIPKAQKPNESAVNKALLFQGNLHSMGGCPQFLTVSACLLHSILNSLIVVSPQLSWRSCFSSGLELERNQFGDSLDVLFLNEVGFQ